MPKMSRRRSGSEQQICVNFTSIAVNLKVTMLYRLEELLSQSMDCMNQKL